ncbi:hypothetical protein ACFE04_009039 [Oxalis oulophora]
MGETNSISNRGGDRAASASASSAEEWLEKELIELLSKKVIEIDKDIISALVSYCQLALPLDAKEYLDNIIGQDIGKTITQEYLRLRGHTNPVYDSHVKPSSSFQAYVKPSTTTTTTTTTSNTNKSFNKQKCATLPTNYNNNNNNAHAHAHAHAHEHEPTTNPLALALALGVNHQNTPKPIPKKKKKPTKLVSLAEAAKGAIIFHQGKPCSCQARRHKLITNCLSCGKIVCEQEGEGPCHFCGTLVLKEATTYAALQQETMPPPLSHAQQQAQAFAKRLLDYDRNSAARTTVIDDQSDYYEIDGNSWLSNQEKDLLKKKQAELQEAERLKRSKVVVTFDLLGRKVILNKDEVPQLESENRILRPVDERELNRIKPNPNLKLQPVFIDPGRIKNPVKIKQPSKSLPSSLCLEITGRVQHDNDVRHFVTDNQQATSSSGGEDDVECSLDYN